jgi:hypothetical protein
VCVCVCVCGWMETRVTLELDKISENFFHTIVGFGYGIMHDEYWPFRPIHSGTLGLWQTFAEAQHHDFYNDFEKMKHNRGDSDYPESFKIKISSKVQLLRNKMFKYWIMIYIIIYNYKRYLFKITLLSLIFSHFCEAFIKKRKRITV